MADKMLIINWIMIVLSIFSLFILAETFLGEDRFGEFRLSPLEVPEYQSFINMLFTAVISSDEADLTSLPVSPEDPGS